MSAREGGEGALPYTTCKVSRFTLMYLLWCAFFGDSVTTWTTAIPPDSLRAGHRTVSRLDLANTVVPVVVLTVVGWSR